MRPLHGLPPPRPWHPISQDRTAEQARAELSTAMTLYHAMDMTFWLPQAEAALAHVG